MQTSPASRAALVGAVTLGLAACSPTEDAAPTTEASLSVAAAFYPLEFVAESVGASHVDVIALAPPGVEPHDLEMSPVGVTAVRDADMVLFLSGFQPAVDDAIDATGANGADVAGMIPLAASSDDHDGVGMDPHFWLDPTLLAQYAEGVGDEFAALDPANADEYRANAAALAASLTRLDAEYAAGLASCERETVLVSHEAFGYLTSRYGLVQVGLSGIDPDAEPSPARIREVRALAETIGATTVYAETLVDPSVMEAFARDGNLAVATLDPAESTTADDDYLGIMGRNLAALKEGLGCS